MDESDYDLSSFEVEEDWDGRRACPEIIISKSEEERLNKPWRKIVIINLWGRKIGFKALESKRFQLWAREGVLDIIDLSHEYYMVKFNSYYDYDLTLTGGP